MGLKVHAAYFVQQAPIAAISMSSVNSEKDKRYEMELVPQGLLVRVKGWPRTILIGHANIRSCELSAEEPAAPAQVAAATQPSAAPDPKAKKVA